jgi:hypothetical protein
MLSSLEGAAKPVTLHPGMCRCRKKHSWTCGVDNFISQHLPPGHIRHIRDSAIIEANHGTHLGTLHNALITDIFTETILLT